MSDDELFLTAILNCSRSDLYAKPLELSPEQKERFVDMQRRRSEGDPVQYICGFTEFLGHRIEVGSGVLIPRPETEVLADTVIQDLRAHDLREYCILDIGTGSGCIPIAMVKALPGCRAVGVDVSAQALAFAKKNAVLNNIADRIEFVERDIFWFMDEALQRFDAVVSNPPYVPTYQLDRLPADVRKEPSMALDGGPDGLHFYRYIIPTARRLLKAGGLLALEFGDGQRKEIEKLFAITGGWDRIRFEKDNAGRPRVALALKQTTE